MKHYWADDASRTGNKEMSQVSSPAGGLWRPLQAARGQIPREAWDPKHPPYPFCAGSWGQRVPGCVTEEQLVRPVPRWHLASGSWGWRCPDWPVLPSTQPGSSTTHSSSGPAGASSSFPWKPKPGDGGHWQRPAVWGALSLQRAFCMVQTHGGHPGCLLWV